MRNYCAILLIALVAGCANFVSRDVRVQLAPTGTLRVAFDQSNASLNTINPATGEPRGIAIDIARELGRRAGVPVRFLSYGSAAELAASIKSGQWDIAFFFEPARAGEIVFSPPYVQIEASYLVRKDSTLFAVGDIDRGGVAIAVEQGAVFESTLKGLLRHTKLVQTNGFTESVRILTEQKVDAVAFLKPALISYVESTPGFRVLYGRFVYVPQAIGIPKDREAAAEYLQAFVRDIKQSGFVAKVIADNKAGGLLVAR